MILGQALNQTYGLSYEDIAWLMAGLSITAPIASISKPAQFDILKGCGYKSDKRVCVNVR